MPPNHVRPQGPVRIVSAAGGALRELASHAGSTQRPDRHGLLRFLAPVRADLHQAVPDRSQRLRSTTSLRLGVMRRDPADPPKSSVRGRGCVGGKGSRARMILLGVVTKITAPCTV